MYLVGISNQPLVNEECCDSAEGCTESVPLAKFGVEVKIVIEARHLRSGELNCHISILC